ncbi:MAG: superoxide dismutase [Ni] [Planctomycetota bacterium]
MKHAILTAAIAGTLVLVTPQIADAHCQVPCGIYGDELKFQELYQHIETVEKSMKLIGELAGSHDAHDQQQLVRWVTNKDEHATKIQREAESYFLAQRIQLPGDGADEAAIDKYNAQLAALHEMIVYAMRCKQTLDLENVEKLRASLDELRALYFDEQALKHIEHHRDHHHDHDHDHGDHEG